MRQRRPSLLVPYRLQFATVRGTLAGSKQLQEGIGAAVRQAALSPGARPAPLPHRLLPVLSHPLGVRS
jgi:hypothetical protein